MKLKRKRRKGRHSLKGRKGETRKVNVICESSRSGEQQIWGRKKQGLFGGE